MRQLKPPKATTHSTLIAETECLKVIDTFRCVNACAAGRWEEVPAIFTYWGVFDISDVKK